MPTNEFLPFATAGGANVQSQADYVAEAARLVGVVAGTAKSSLANKSWRQAASMAAMIGQFIINRGGTDALDNGNIATLLAGFELAYRSQSTNYVSSVGGTANAMTATLDPAITNYSQILGAPLRLLIAITNSGAATLNLNGLGAKSIVTLRGAAIARGDMPSGAIVTVIYTGTAFMMIGISYSEVPLIGSPVLYVRTDGNDANDGSANNAANAMATIAAAAARAASKYFAVNGNITIQLGNPGTYAAPGNLPIASGTILVRGDPATPTNFIIAASVNPAGAGAMIAGVGGLIELDGFTTSVTGPAVSHVAMAGTGLITCRNIRFASSVTSNGGIVLASAGGSIFVDSGCTIGASASSAFSSSAGTVAIRAGVSVLTVAFSGAFCIATNGGSVVVDSASFSGTCTGSRYAAILNGVINTNGGGANFFPGSAVGTTATGGQYA